MDLAFKRLSAIGVFVFAIILVLLIWDWSCYWLPKSLEVRLFLSSGPWVTDDGPFQIRPESSLAARIEALREWKITREIKKQERAANALRWEHFEAFDFAGEYLSCENSLEGRWFLHFGEDGVVRTAVPGDKRFAKDNQDPDFPVVDLGKIFEDSTAYRRIDGRTMEFSNASGSWRFSMTPILDAVDGSLEPLPIDSCCNRIVFESLEGPEIRFELWRDEANASKFEHFLRQRKE